MNIHVDMGSQMQEIFEIHVTFEISGILLIEAIELSELSESLPRFLRGKARYIDIH